MDQLTRIEKLLERIAVALEKMEEPRFEIRSDTVIGPGRIDIKDGSLDDWKKAIDKYVHRGPAPEQRFGTDHFAQRFGIDYSVMGDCDYPTNADCASKFVDMYNYGGIPNNVNCTDWDKQSE